MITINSIKINTINQKNYNKLINSIDFNCVTCSCGHSGCLTKHAYYKRYIKTDCDSKVCLSILRVKCSICKHTHAVFPVFIVPYSQVSLDDHISIINNYLSDKSQKDLMNRKCLIDENTVRYILHNYKKYWHQRLTSFGISLKHSLDEVSFHCIKFFNRQFMQINCTLNIFISMTHIT